MPLIIAVRKNDVIAKKIPMLLQLDASAVTNVGVALPHPKVSVDQLFGGSRGRTRARTSEIRSKRAGRWGRRPPSSAEEPEKEWELDDDVVLGGICCERCDAYDEADTCDCSFNAAGISMLNITKLVRRRHHHCDDPRAHQ